MAIALVQNTTHISATDVSIATTAAITTTVGNLVVITASVYRSGGTTIAVSDSKSNTWVTDHSLLSGSSNTDDGRVIIASCILATAGSGHTFTVDDTVNAQVYMEVTASEFSATSGWTASPTDKKAQDQGDSGDTACAPVTATLSQAEELAVACLMSSVHTSSINILSPPSGWTAIALTTYPGGIYRCGHQASYKIVADGAAQTASWTFDNAGDLRTNVGVIATYKATAVAGPPPIIESNMRIPAQMLEGEDVFQAEALSLKAWF